MIEAQDPLSQDFVNHALLRSADPSNQKQHNFEGGGWSEQSMITVTLLSGSIERQAQNKAKFHRTSRSTTHSVEL